MHVIHDMDSGFVTYHKNKNDISGHQSEVNEIYISLYKVAVEAWRNELKVSDSKKMIAAFAWCHDEELRFCQESPEFLGYDVTFRVTKERRDVFIIAGIDVNDKLFTCFHCLIPSKQSRVYHWALRVAARSFLSDNILSLNQCIACD